MICLEHILQSADNSPAIDTYSRSKLSDFYTLSQPKALASHSVDSGTCQYNLCMRLTHIDYCELLHFVFSTSVSTPGLSVQKHSNPVARHLFGRQKKAGQAGGRQVPP